MQTGRNRRSPLPALILILALAFAVRVFRIDWQSVWYDEGLSLYYARGDLSHLLENVTQSEHPPLHALLLHFWVRLCGDSELAARMLSAWWGVFAVACLYRLGRRLSPPIGVLAALLLAVSPFAVWYSQEIRGYTLALALTIGLVDLSLDLLPTLAGSLCLDRRALGARYAAYVLLAIGGVYTHLYTGFVLLAMNLAYMALLVRAWRYTGPGRLKQGVLLWGICQLVIASSFAPWLPFALAQLRTNATYWHGGVGWRQIVAQTLVAWSVGETLTGPWASTATWLLLLLCLLGTLALMEHRANRPRLLTFWLWIAVSIVAQVILGRSRPKFAPRYLLSVLPAYLVLVSAGLRWLYEWTRKHAFTAMGWTATALTVCSAAVMGGATARSLANAYLDLRFAKPDFRAVAAYISEHANPDDLIVLVGGHSYPALTYYYRGAVPILSLPDRLLPTTREPVDLHALDRLNQAIVGKRQLWLVLWQAELADPTGLVSDELQHTYRRLGVGRTFHDIALLLFDVAPGPLLPQGVAPRVPLAADLGGEIRLLGYDLPALAVPPGGTLYLYLYWQSLVQPSHDYRVFVHVRDENNQIIAQHDRIAGADAYPTSHWVQGAIVRDRFLLTLPAQTKPGQYTLITGLYRSDPQMPRLPVTGPGGHGDYVLLTTVRVQTQ